MAKKNETGAAAPKTVRASRKKEAPVHEAHGAVETRPAMNMMEAFGISDGYSVKDLESYKRQINDMTTTDLHDHAHAVGVIPLDPREKLVKALENKFVQTRMDRQPPKVIHVKTRAQTDPEFAKFMKQYWAGEATNAH